MLRSLGIIETEGLAAALEAADSAIKAANVDLVGYEKSKGGGWITVKVLGDLGSVKASINAASASVTKMGKLVSSDVITRPISQIEPLIKNKETRGYYEQ